MSTPTDSTSQLAAVDGTSDEWTTVLYKRSTPSKQVISNRTRGRERGAGGSNTNSPRRGTRPARTVSENTERRAENKGASKGVGRSGGISVMITEDVTPSPTTTEKSKKDSPEEHKKSRRPRRQHQDYEEKEGRGRGQGPRYRSAEYQIQGPLPAWYNPPSWDANPVCRHRY